MSFQTISIATDARGVARLTLERADKHNALSALMIAELTEAAVRLGEDPKVRVVVLTGAGASFCAGGDLGWMRDQMAADAETRFREARALAMLRRHLPFAVPDHPLTASRLEHLTEQGLNAFTEYSVPEAILKLRQGVGRLIRTATDKGICAILDNRILTKPYGRAFLASLPECPTEVLG